MALRPRDPKGSLAPHLGVSSRLVLVLDRVTARRQTPRPARSPRTPQGASEDRFPQAGGLWLRHGSHTQAPSAPLRASDIRHPTFSVRHPPSRERRSRFDGPMRFNSVPSLTGLAEPQRAERRRRRRRPPPHGAAASRDSNHQGHPPVIAGRWRVRGNQAARSPHGRRRHGARGSRPQVRGLRCQSSTSISLRPGKLRSNDNCGPKQVRNHAACPGTGTLSSPGRGARSSFRGSLRGRSVDVR